MASLSVASDELASVLQFSSPPLNFSATPFVPSSFLESQPEAVPKASKRTRCPRSRKQQVPGLSFKQTRIQWRRKADRAWLNTKDTQKPIFESYVVHSKMSVPWKQISDFVKQASKDQD